MTRTLILTLTACLAACAPPADDRPDKRGEGSVQTMRSRHCPDPDNRDSRDPCSVAYMKPIPRGRLTEDDLR